MKLYGLVTERGEWRIKTDREQRKFHKIRDVIADIKRRMLKRLGHAIGMYETSAAKEMFEIRLECSVNVRGPASR